MSDRRNPPEKRKGIFREKLSLFMVVVAALGAFLVLLDPQFSGELFGTSIAIGGDGFSADLKGAVISAILIGGWTAVKEYWLGASAAGQNQSETMSRIAEQSAPAAAAAVAAAVSPTPAVPIKTQTMNVQADTANVTENK